MKCSAGDRFFRAMHRGMRPSAVVTAQLHNAETSCDGDMLPDANLQNIAVATTSRHSISSQSEHCIITSSSTICWCFTWPWRWGVQKR
ncbi:hypothetical protein Y032_0083g1633 [Ancylostoma ceylanicum]|uniref:Uncharacterized protein n=1 Tax=Ancylostoma ceylanicum TaxID=53326 RepID=A0A016TRA6_9BILA|nr:hypothetical protein Y032_0083g1633 [Ancylostoma ceylanicum]